MARNELDKKQFDTTAEEELPFFLNFGESYLDQIKQETVDTLEPQLGKRVKRQTKELDSNELIDRLGDPAERVLQKICIDESKKQQNHKKVYSDLFNILKDLSAPEIDYFIKKNLFSDEKTALRFAKFFAFCFKEKTEFDFKQALLKHFLIVNLLDLL